MNKLKALSKTLLAMLIAVGVTGLITLIIYALELLTTWWILPACIITYCVCQIAQSSIRINRRKEE